MRERGPHRVRGGHQGAATGARPAHLQRHQVMMIMIMMTTVVVVVGRIMSEVSVCTSGAGHGSPVLLLVPWAVDACPIWRVLSLRRDFRDSLACDL